MSVRYAPLLFASQGTARQGPPGPSVTATAPAPNGPFLPCGAVWVLFEVP